MSRIKRVEVHGFEFEQPDFGRYPLSIERRELEPADGSLPGAGSIGYSSASPAS